MLIKKCATVNRPLPQKKKMEEWKDYYGYKVSNKGRVLNRYGREVKGYVQKERGYEYRKIILRINKVRTCLHLNTLVCRLFNPNYQENARVYNLDGDINNCAIENLKLSKAYTAKPTEEQIAVYEKEVFACVKHYFKIQGWIESQKFGIDIDNAMGNAYLWIFKYLPAYTIGTSFYCFCAKYCRIAFKYEYKSEKKQQKILEDQINEFI